MVSAFCCQESRHLAVIGYCTDPRRTPPLPGACLHLFTLVAVLNKTRIPWPQAITFYSERNLLGMVGTDDGQLILQTRQHLLHGSRQQGQDSQQHVYMGRIRSRPTEGNSTKTVEPVNCHLLSVTLGMDETSPSSLQQGVNAVLSRPKTVTLLTNTKPLSHAWRKHARAQSVTRPSDGQHIA